MTATEANSAANPASTRVAIVEDNPPMRRNLERMLRRRPGIACACVCESAEEAERELPAAQPDVVLMDINLPGASGIECAARLKQLMPAVQVIMLTVYEDSESIFNALKAGACGYLLKRASPGEIIEAIGNVRAGGAPMTSEIARKVVRAFHAPAPPQAPAATLSAREREILELLCQGRLSKEIADQLAISFHTVRVHLKHIYEKLHVRSRAEAAFKFLSQNSGRSDTRSQGKPPA